MSHKAKILVVEDSKNQLIHLQCLFESKDYEVITAEYGREMLKKLSSQTPDIILTDILMPELDGLEVPRIIRTFNKDIPIIYQPAYFRNGMCEKRMQAGCVDYIGMPVKRKEVIEGIKRNMQEKIN